MKANAFATNWRTYGNAFWLCLLEKLLFLLTVLFLCAAADALGHYVPVVAVVCMLLLTVYRFVLSYRLSGSVCPKKTNDMHLNRFYRLLKAACVRLLCGGIWSIPFCLLVYQLYRYVDVLPATEWNRDFTQIGALVLSNAAKHEQMYVGMILFFALLLAALGLFVYGWHRGLVFEFVQVNNASLRRTLKNARNVRKQVRKQLAHAFWVNSVLFLPALIAPFLLPYLQLAPLLTGKLMNDLSLIFAYLKAGILSGEIIIQSILLFAGLYLPLLPVRKLNYAKAVLHGYATDKQ